MIGWVIALSIFGLIAVLLMSSVKVVLDINDNVFFEIGFLGISLYTFDSIKQKVKEVKPKKIKTEKPKEKSKLVATLKEYAKGKHKKELIEEILEIIKIICVKLKKLLRHIRFKKVYLDLAVATADAAETAILYGRLCSVIYSIVSLLDCAVNFDPKKISVRTDFTSENIKLTLSGVIKLRVWFIVVFALSLTFTVLKIKIGDIKNGRT